MKGIEIIPEFTTNITTIIWDLDGTLLDSFASSASMWQQAFRSQGLAAPTSKQLADNYSGTVPQTAAALAAGASKSKLAAVVREFLMLDSAAIQNPDSHLFADAVRLAERAYIAGIKQILVTNRAHGTNRQNASPRNLVKNSQLSPYIGTIICGDEGTHSKPDPAVLTNTVPAGANLLVIGDQLIDAQFAGNLNCRAVIVNRDDTTVARVGRHLSHATVVRSLDEVVLG